VIIYSVEYPVLKVSLRGRFMRAIMNRRACEEYKLQRTPLHYVLSKLWYNFQILCRLSVSLAYADIVSSLRCSFIEKFMLYDQILIKEPDTNLAFPATKSHKASVRVRVKL
jgi:hypothetical protein